MDQAAWGYVREMNSYVMAGGIDMQCRVEDRSCIQRLQFLDQDHTTSTIESPHDGCMNPLCKLIDR